jgi:probable rRNA maturation factor
MPHREVLNETGAAVDLRSIDALIEHHLVALGIHPDSVIAVTFIDTDRMTTLHEDWMQEPGPTDVLSFPIDELTLPAAGEISGPGILGDIVICPEFLGPQMLESGRTLQQESEFLVTHGILHLLGMDHQEPADHARMFALQDTLLSDWLTSNNREGTN